MKRVLSGIVKSNSTKDTAVVEVALWRTHRIFQKRYKTTKRYLVQNTDNASQVGETVLITPCRPISKRKTWTITTNEPVVAKEVAAKKVKKA